MSLKTDSIVLLAAGATVAVLAGALAFAGPQEDEAPVAPEMQLPPGWTAEDMKKCGDAAMPGKMHETLQACTGVWKGATRMWMAPGMELTPADHTWTITPILDGRFIRTEVNGEMPGMGPYSGIGLTGFDNVSREFVGTWIENWSTGIMTGTGTLSQDGKTLSWRFHFNCPITGKPTLFREEQHFKGDDSMSVEMFAIDPKGGKEYKCMQVELTRGS